ncbi:MAG TPA: sugar phosphate nucleotidyltransferase [Anaerolineales bacterium]|nr:sugar phosphate nucleotidyltransferase [Anaerolineales bacterium]
MKIVIPMAGRGTRLRPHTWSKPKQLLGVAGRPVLDHVLDTLSTLAEPENIELINIVGYLGEQIEEHITENYPHIKSHFVLQEEPRGQSHAIYLAREHLNGPMMVVFADTLLETDLSFLANETAEAVVWIKPVPDPRRFGVAVAGPDGWVTHLIEKPQEMENNLAVVGFYYFSRSEDLLAAIEEQMRRDIQLKGEYFLADAINIMLERGLKMRTEKVEVWLDAGTPEALLETNRYLLDNRRNNDTELSNRTSLVVIHPVFIHPTAQVENSILGPYVSIGAGASVRNSILRDSILEDEAQVEDVILENSLIGRRAHIQRRAGIINAGDHTEVTL